VYTERIYIHHRLHYKSLRQEEKKVLWKTKKLTSGKMCYLPATRKRAVNGFPLGLHSGRQVVTNYDGRGRHNREGQKVKVYFYLCFN
jgi:hypothetical protein